MVLCAFCLGSGNDGVSEAWFRPSEAFLFFGRGMGISRWAGLCRGDCWEGGDGELEVGIGRYLCCVC